MIPDALPTSPRPFFRPDAARRRREAATLREQGTGHGAIGALLATLALGFALLLAGCDAPSPEPQRSNATLIMWNWPNYMTAEALDGFERETGIKVEQRIFSDEEVLLGAMQGTDFRADMLIVSESMARELIQARVVDALDPAQIPNLRHIEKASLAQSHHEGRLYGAPYLSGTTGVAVNIRHVPEGTDSWAVLWDESLRGRIAMLGNNFEVVAAASMKLGYGIVPTTEEQFAAVEAELMRQRPLLKGYLDIDELAAGLADGEIWAAQIYSGDALGAMEKNPDLRYFVPREGATRWTDMIMLHRSSGHPKEVHAFIDYLNRPEVMARLSGELYCATTNSEAKALVSKDILADHGVYPPPEVLARCSFMPPAPPSDISARRTSELWNALTAP
jgi:spermidine/putrescine transport system substrate-binding protein